MLKGKRALRLRSRSLKPAEIHCNSMKDLLQSNDCYLAGIRPVTWSVLAVFTIFIVLTSENHYEK